MKFEHNACPKCKSINLATIETIPGTCGLMPDDDDHPTEWEYDGMGTDIFWDGQEPVKDDEGRWEFICHDCDHVWFNRYLGES